MKDCRMLRELIPQARRGIEQGNPGLADSEEKGGKHYANRMPNSSWTFPKPH